MKKYGKSSAGLIRLKSEFFTENKARLETANHHAEAYRRQKARISCKLCGEKLPRADFIKLGIGYSFCTICGHLSGLHEDTNEFCSLIYTKDNGSSYARNYHEHDIEAYANRVSIIYQPKVSFLRESLDEHGVSLDSQKVLDLGAGSGYFVKALLDNGVTDVRGYEVSRFQVDYANEMIGTQCIYCNEPDSLVKIVDSSDADIVSLIGVMEHLQDPIAVLNAIKNNPHIRYVYLCVPMFSLTVYLEMIFSETVMPRQLTGGHTHLFTDASLNYLESTFGFVRASEWWFGTDIVDFYRSVYTQICRWSGNSSMIGKWEKYMVDEIDSIQLILDKSHKSSQVHILWKVERNNE